MMTQATDINFPNIIICNERKIIDSEKEEEF